MIAFSVQNVSYPQIQSHILHPCVSGSQQAPACGDFFAATSILRFDSFFTQKRVVVSLTFEVRCQPAACPLLSLEPPPALQRSHRIDQSCQGHFCLASHKLCAMAVTEALPSLRVLQSAF